MSRGVWNTLDRLACGQVPAAVLAEWRRLTDSDFHLLSGFLRVTQRVAGDYPCLGDPDCGCRHELAQCDDTRWVARCQCGVGGCAPAWLAPSDLIIHELDAAGFGGAVARALGFGPPDSAAVLYAAPKMWPVGTYAATRSAVYLGIFPSEAELFANVEGLMASRPEPFILLTPTTGLRSAAVDSFLARAHCGLVPLASCLAGDGRGILRVTSPIEPVLKRFAGEVAQARNMGPLLEGIHREIAALRDDPRGLPAPQPAIDQGEAQRIFAVLTKLRTETGVRKAPLHTVFEYMVMQGISGEETARKCKCAPSLISARVKTLKERFGMSVGQLHNYASAINEMKTAVKGDRRRGRKSGQAEDFERLELGAAENDEQEGDGDGAGGEKEEDAP